MGYGRWETDTYTSSKALRSSKGIADFAYSDKAKNDTSVPVSPNLDPLRINKKPFKKLESRDSVDHPESNAIFVSFDCTGSNLTRAVEAQKKLPNLMDLLEKYIADPQVLVAANDDYKFEANRSIQISDYESDNKIDEHIRSVILTGNGGGNFQESYDLILYAAARKTIIDCMEKRKKKGYFFMYADEPIPEKVDKNQVAAIFGDKLGQDIDIEQIIKELKALYNVFIVWPQGGYLEARDQYVKLFGEECVVTLQSPSLICELMSSMVGMFENRDAGALAADLEKIGTSKAQAKEVISTVKKVRRKFGELPDSPDAVA